ncbi:hypothetical protein AC579_8021 [Pseudocercospora musae]|uniref:F-box domain-containing protein n=1 Tax=Pseudocercospora musae TaxID=113226 RepID=A0A139IPI3_9PEZI|nr:hypothetical protein AC579_8021 [Pseudocercospora musae]
MARTKQHVASTSSSQVLDPEINADRPSSRRAVLLPSDSPACSQIGYVSEVVAALVRHLPTLDLARLRRVSRVWKYEIDRSPTCQEKLFHYPVAVAPKQMLLWTEDPASADAYDVFLKDITIEEEDMDRYEISRVVAALHPIFDGPIARGDVIQCTNVDTEKLLALDDPSQSLAHGSWQEMFLTRPATNSVLIDLEFVFDEGPFLHEPKVVFYDIELYRSEGVQLRTIIDGLRKGLNTSAPDYWSWLPEEYYSGKIELDDYIASYGFPRFKGARLRIPGSIHEDHQLVRQAQRSGNGKTKERFVASDRILDHAMQDTDYLMHMLRVS